MVRRCYVPDCLSEEGKEEHQGVTFHKIPMHPDIRPKWMSLCHIPDDKKTMKVIYICSRHFLNADFCHFKGKKYMLRQGVLPSVFPWKKAVLKKPKVRKNNSTTKNNAENGCDSSSKSKSERKIETKLDSSKMKSVPSTSESVSPNNSSIPLSDLDQPENNSLVSLSAIDQLEKIEEEKIKAFTPNMQIEALDFNEIWYPAQIVEVDYEENEVLIHFEKYSSKYDEWISMDSSRLRPLQTKKEVEKFVVGEKCLASWSDARKFQATVTKVVDDGVYEVQFDDGCVKTLRVHRMAKIDGKQLQSSPLFDPVKGTKQERRDRKRKINVAELFGKRSRPSDASVEEIVSPVPEEFDNWIPKWENGKPVGEESSLELHDGARKSVIIADPRLPQNWVKHLVQRLYGTSAGKWDTVIISPEGKRFRTRSEIKTFIETHPNCNLSEAMFDFSLHKKNRRQGNISDSPQVSFVDTSATIGVAPSIGGSAITAASSNNANATATQTSEDNESATEGGDASKSLKILLIDGVFQCPIDGCGKSFRRENLAQMHVKHYHPEYTKFLDSTPNVADLAYARTVGENLDKCVERPEKPKQAPVRNQTPKSSQSKNILTHPKVEEDSSPIVSEPEIPPVASHEVKSEVKEESVMKDSEILKLLNTKPCVGSGAIKYPPGLPPNAYPDIKLKDLLRKSEAVPLDVKENPQRPPGIKTLLPVIKSESKTTTHENINQNSYPGGVKTEETLPERFQTDQKPVVNNTSETPSQDSNYIVEGGEVIKIVQMKREEIINCTCGVTEEDGLMIQCELCLCWQHAYCNNIERENQVPEKYICYICQNPTRNRSSRTYYHDQDWLKHGTLTVGSYHCKDEETLLKRFEKLKKSHDYSGALVELKTYIHNLQIKLKVAEAKNHPKLYLWSKSWPKHSESENETIQKNCPGTTDKTSVVEKPKNLPVEEDTVIKAEDSTSLDSLSSSSMLLSLLKEAKKEDCKESEEEGESVVKIPQPEAAIDSSECRLNLLDHINHCQDLVESRLNNLEEKIEYLDSVCEDGDKNHVQICRTLRMLLNDLVTLQDFSQSSSL